MTTGEALKKYFDLRNNQDFEYVLPYYGGYDYMLGEIDKEYLKSCVPNARSLQEIVGDDEPEYQRGREQERNDWEEASSPSYSPPVTDGEEDFQTPRRRVSDPDDSDFDMSLGGGDVDQALLASVSQHVSIMVHNDNRKRYRRSSSGSDTTDVRTKKSRRSCSRSPDSERRMLREIIPSEDEEDLEPQMLITEEEAWIKLRPKRGRNTSRIEHKPRDDDGSGCACNKCLDQPIYHYKTSRNEKVSLFERLQQNVAFSIC